MPTFPLPTAAGRRPRTATFAALLAGLVVAASACSTASGSAPGDAPVRPAPLTVAPHTFVRTLRLTGLTESVHSISLAAPVMAGSRRGMLTIVRLAPAGSAVKTGDILVEFDRQDQEEFAFDKQAEYDNLVQQIEKTRAEQQAARVKDETDIEQAKDDVRARELDVLDQDLRPRIEAEQNAQKLEEARAKLAALQKSAPLRRAAERAALRILEIQRERARLAMEYARQNVAAMTIRSPISGLVVPATKWAGNGPGDVREGDQLWPGAPLIAVVSQAGMRVRAKVSQADAAAIRAGQPAVVRLDSYPGTPFTGRVEQIGPTALPGAFSTRVRAFTVVVSIDGTHPRLLPDLSAAVDVEVERIERALTVPRHALRWNGDAPAVLVLAGARVEPRHVELGPGNETDVVIARGIQPGDVVQP